MKSRTVVNAGVWVLLAGGIPVAVQAQHVLQFDRVEVVYRGGEDLEHCTHVRPDPRPTPANGGVTVTVSRSCTFNDEKIEFSATARFDFQTDLIAVPVSGNASVATSMTASASSAAGFLEGLVNGDERGTGCFKGMGRGEAGSTAVNETVNCVAVLRQSGSQWLVAGQAAFQFSSRQLTAILTVNVYYNDLNCDPAHPVEGCRTGAAAIDHLEVVQAVQDAANSVPLVAGKPAYLRVFVKAPQPVDNVTAILRGFRGGDELPDSRRLPDVLTPRSSTSLTAKPTFARADLTDSINFKLPKEWLTAGTVQLFVELQTADGPAGNDSARADLSVEFVEQPAFRIAWSPWCYQDTNFLSEDCLDPEAIRRIAGFGYFLKESYPLAPERVVYKQLAVPPQTFRGIIGRTFGVDDPGSDFMKELNRLFDSGLSKDFDQLIGYLPQIDGSVEAESELSTAGTGRVVMIEYLEGFAGGDNHREKTVAHEIGHNLGREHTYMCKGEGYGKGFGNGGWPYKDAAIQEPGLGRTQNGVLWVFSPNSPDLMSYCDAEQGKQTAQNVNYDSSNWISPYTYKELFKTLQSRLRPPEKANSVRPLAVETATEQIVISGWAKSDGSAGALDPVYRAPLTLNVPGSLDNGSHCIEFSGPAGALGTYCFQLNFQYRESGFPMDKQYFSFRAPLPPGTTRLALRVAGGRELAFLSASPAPPIVAIDTPKTGDTWTGTGPRTVSWRGSDPDGDPLLYALHYSADGGQTWLPLTVDSRDTEFRFDPAYILGGSNVMFRVLATDGFHNARADAGPIDIVQKPQIQPDRSAVDFGPQRVGQRSTQSVRITNTGNGPLEIRSIDVDDPRFEVTSGQGLLIPFGATRSIDVTFLSGASGNRQAKLTIASNDPERPSIAIDLSGLGAATGNPKIAVEQRSLSFGSVASGGKVFQSLRVSNTGDVGLNVTRIAAPGPFSVSGGGFPVAPGASVDLSVGFFPPGPAAFTGTLTLTSDDPSQPSTAIALSGTGTGPQVFGPKAEVTPASLSFGSVTPGQPKRLTVSLANNGDRTITITGLTANAPFNVVSPAAPFDVLPRPASITVEFKPAAAGSYSGALTIATDSVLQPTLTVPLTGEGTGSADCSFSLEATSASVPASSSGTTFRVTASSQTCAWTASSNVDWIVITTGPKGVGSGVLGYSVAANPTNSSRSGVLLVAGIRYTVTQAAGAANLPLTTDVVVKGDGGTFAVSAGPSGSQTTASYVVRLTPPAYPAVLKNVQVYFGNRADGLAVDAPLAVVATTNPAASPNIDGLQWFSIPYYVGALGSFNSFPMPAATINGGEFVVGFSVTTAAGIRPVEVDVTSPSARRSYFSADGRATFGLIDSLGIPGNFAIRATVAVPGSGSAAPSIEVTPSSLDFGTVTAGQPKDLSVRVRNTGSAALTVSSVTGLSAPFSTVLTSFTVAPGSFQDLAVRFAPTAAGVQSRTLTIVSNDPSRPSVGIPISGTGVGAPAAPAIAVSPASIDFGSVTTGTPLTRTVAITNSGTAALTVGSIATSAPFSVTPAAILQLAAGASTTVTVTFTPTATGAVSRSLTIASNDPARASVTVALSGTGTAASGQTVTLAVDDGNYELSLGFPLGGVTAYFVNRLTPTRYPATLRAVQIFFPEGELPVGTPFRVLAAPNPSGAGAAGGATFSDINFQTANAQITATERMVEYAVTPITIQSGDFLVGFAAQNPVNVYPAVVDSSPPLARRSYLSYDGVLFRLLEGTSAGNLGIRARVD